MGSDVEVIVTDDEGEPSNLKPLGKDDADPSPKEIYNAIVNLSKSHNKLAADVQKFQRETSEFIKANKSNIEKLPELFDVQEKQGERINKLERRLDFMQQREKENNLVIHGIPRVSADKLPLVFRKLSKIILGVDGPEFDYISAMKVKPGAKDNPIVVRFSRMKDKITLMQMKKEKGDVFIEQLGFDVNKIENRKIILAPQLISSVYNLLKEAKKMKSLGYQFIWSRNTSVFIQKNPDSAKIKFDCFDDLNQYKMSLKG